MRNLLLILLAFLAVFTYIRTIDASETSETAVIKADVSREIPVEIIR
jgi:hypothetical protein